MWIADNWKEYEVIDCSNGEKLERWGDYILVRPDLRSFGILRKPERNGDVRTDIITAAKKAVVNGSSLIFHNSGTYTIRI